MDAVGGVLMVAGAVFALLAGVGVLRFGDTYARMHAASKGPTLGLLLVALGAGMRIGTWPATATLVLVVILQLLTTPVGAHLVGRAVHELEPGLVDDVDELADRDAAERTSASGAGPDGDATPS
jgi:multicomponent Na+:H+ antiporter subunit G